MFVPYSDSLWHTTPIVPIAMTYYGTMYGACQILVDAHIPFDVLFTGDGNILQDTITVNDLKKYKVVYLTHDRSILTSVHKAGKL
jgi:hypothetical protein